MFIRVDADNLSERNFAFNLSQKHAYRKKFEGNDDSNDSAPHDEDDVSDVKVKDTYVLLSPTINIDDCVKSVTKVNKDISKVIKPSKNDRRPIFTVVGDSKDMKNSKSTSVQDPLVKKDLSKSVKRI